MNWQELLKAFVEALQGQLTAAGADEAKKREVIQQATDALPQDARSFLTNLGFGAAYADLKKEKQTWEAKETEYKNQLTAKDGELTTLRAGTPDLDKIRKDNEKALLDKDTAHQAAMQKLEEKFNASIEDGFRTRVLAALVGDRHKVDPIIAEAHVQKLTNRTRLTVEDDKRFVKVYQADGLTPALPPSGTEPWEYLADEVAQGIDGKYKGSGVRSGPGVQNGGTPSGGTTTDEQLRERRATRYQAL